MRPGEKFDEGCVGRARLHGAILKNDALLDTAPLQGDREVDDVDGGRIGPAGPIVLFGARCVLGTEQPVDESALDDFEVDPSRASGRSARRCAG